MPAFEGAAAAALTSSDPQSHTYRFDAAKLSTAGLTLAPGKVMLLAGTALRKVRSVRQEGGALVVETDYAALTDAIEEGHFGFDAKLAFDTAHAVSVVDQYGGEHALVSARSALGSPGVIPEGAIPWSFQQGPMTYEFEVTRPAGEVYENWSAANTRYLIHDRDPLFTQDFTEIRAVAGVKTVKRVSTHRAPVVARNDDAVYRSRTRGA
ncbi:MAG: hypothetical protein IPI67_32415 [Myxococcales bacterium]|nr:hypothetical protein [Myxococcales bacterium]